jgi:hypothetical protein
VFGEYPYDGAFDGWGGIEQVGCYLLDRIALCQELRLPRDAFSTPGSFKCVHGGIADLALNGLAVVQHVKGERQPFGVVSYNLATRQRHRNFSSKARWKSALPRHFCREGAVGLCAQYCRWRWSGATWSRAVSDPFTPPRGVEVAEAAAGVKVVEVS